MKRLVDTTAFAGSKLVIRTILIDSGYKPEPVYTFCNQYPGIAIPCKGWKIRSKPVSFSQLDHKRKTVKICHIDDGYFKSWVHGRIRREAGTPGAWHIPQDATDDYCQQIVAEQLVQKVSGQYLWIKTQKANHYLDAEKMATAAA